MKKVLSRSHEDPGGPRSRSQCVVRGIFPQCKNLQKYESYIDKQQKTKADSLVMGKTRHTEPPYSTGVPPSYPHSLPLITIKVHYGWCEGGADGRIYSSSPCDGATCASNVTLSTRRRQGDRGSAIILLIHLLIQLLRFQMFQPIRPPAHNLIRRLHEPEE